VNNLIHQDRQTLAAGILGHYRANPAVGGVPLPSLNEACRHRHAIGAETEPFLVSDIIDRTENLGGKVMRGLDNGLVVVGPEIGVMLEFLKVGSFQNVEKQELDVPKIGFVIHWLFLLSGAAES